MKRLSRKEYETCQRALSDHMESLWLRLADGKIDEARYGLLDGKLTEWEAELERRKPGLLRRAVG